MAKAMAPKNPPAPEEAERLERGEILSREQRVAEFWEAVRIERVYQRARFGQFHDGQHGFSQWAALLAKQVARASWAAAFGQRGDFMYALVQMGAVALAAWEAQMYHTGTLSSLHTRQQQQLASLLSASEECEGDTDGQ